MKRGIVLVVALLLICGGALGISGYKAKPTKVASGTQQAFDSKSLQTVHDLNKLKQIGILLTEPKQKPVLSMDQALDIATKALYPLQPGKSRAQIEYWDVAHLSKSGQVPPAIACWVVSFPGLQLPPDSKTEEPRSELTMFIDATNGGVIYVLSYR